jgi:hypothetical protein
MHIGVLGAGLAGLSAAITIAKTGEQVTVFECMPSVGRQIHPNYQALRTNAPGNNINSYLGSLALAPKNFDSKYLSKMLLYTNDVGMRTLFFKNPVAFVMRGGNNSLEYGLYKQALDLGVQFEFTSKKSEKDATIIATGRRKCDAAAFGEIYEAPDFPRDCFFYMHNDRYSPMGWYSYIIPIGEDRIEIVNCASQPHAKKVAALYRLLITEHPFVRKYVTGKKPLCCFGGYGGVDYPTTAFRNGKYYVGEAAGFQDACRGFGMHYALESGHYAAKVIIENLDVRKFQELRTASGRRPLDVVEFPQQIGMSRNSQKQFREHDQERIAVLDKRTSLDYDVLWKNAFAERLRIDFAYRFALSLLGEKAVEWYFRNMKDGDTIDYSILEKHDFLCNIATNLAFNCELLKKRLLRYWSL